MTIQERSGNNGSYPSTDNSDRLSKDCCEIQLLAELFNKALPEERLIDIITNEPTNKKFRAICLRKALDRLSPDKYPEWVKAETAARHIFPVPSQGPYVDQYGRTKLHEACDNKDFSIIREIIRHNPESMNIRDVNGRLPFDFYNYDTPRCVYSFYSSSYFDDIKMGDKMSIILLEETANLPSEQVLALLCQLKTTRLAKEYIGLLARVNRKRRNDAVKKLNPKIIIDSLGRDPTKREFLFQILKKRVENDAADLLFTILKESSDKNLMSLLSEIPIEFVHQHADVIVEAIVEQSTKPPLKFVSLLLLCSSSDILQRKLIPYFLKEFGDISSEELFIKLFYPLRKLYENNISDVPRSLDRLSLINQQGLFNNFSYKLNILNILKYHYLDYPILAMVEWAIDNLPNPQYYINWKINPLKYFDEKIYEIKEANNFMELPITRLMLCMIEEQDCKQFFIGTVDDDDSWEIQRSLKQVNLPNLRVNVIKKMLPFCNNLEGYCYSCLYTEGSFPPIYDLLALSGDEEVQKYLSEKGYLNDAIRSVPLETAAKQFLSYVFSSDKTIREGWVRTPMLFPNLLEAGVKWFGHDMLLKMISSDKDIRSNIIGIATCSDYMVTLLIPTLVKLFPSKFLELIVNSNTQLNRAFTHQVSNTLDENWHDRRYNRTPEDWFVTCINKGIEMGFDPMDYAFYRAFENNNISASRWVEVVQEGYTVLPVALWKKVYNKLFERNDESTELMNPVEQVVDIVKSRGGSQGYLEEGILLIEQLPNYSIALRVSGGQEHSSAANQNEVMVHEDSFLELVAYNGREWISMRKGIFSWKYIESVLPLLRKEAEDIILEEKLRNDYLHCVHDSVKIENPTYWEGMFLAIIRVRGGFLVRVMDYFKGAMVSVKLSTQNEIQDYIERHKQNCEAALRQLRELASKYGAQCTISSRQQLEICSAGTNRLNCIINFDRDKILLSLTYKEKRALSRGLNLDSLERSLSIIKSITPSKELESFLRKVNNQNIPTFFHSSAEIKSLISLLSEKDTPLSVILTPQGVFLRYHSSFLITGVLADFNLVFEELNAVEAVLKIRELNIEKLSQYSLISEPRALPDDVPEIDFGELLNDCKLLFPQQNSIYQHLALTLSNMKRRKLIGWNPKTHEKHYRELEVKLTHIYAKIQNQTADKEECLRSLITTLASHSRYCAKGLSKEVSVLYLSHVQGMDGQQINNNELFSQYVSQALLDFIDRLVQFGPQEQSVHLRAYLRKKLVEMGLTLPHDPLFNGEEQMGQDDIFADESGAAIYNQESIEELLSKFLPSLIVHRLMEAQQVFTVTRDWEGLSQFNRMFIDLIHTSHLLNEEVKEQLDELEIKESEERLQRAQRINELDKEVNRLRQGDSARLYDQLAIAWRHANNEYGDLVSVQQLASQNLGSMEDDVYLSEASSSSSSSSSPIRQHKRKRSNSPLIKHIKKQAKGRLQDEKDLQLLKEQVLENSADVAKLQEMESELDYLNQQNLMLPQENFGARDAIITTFAVEQGYMVEDEDTSITSITPKGCTVLLIASGIFESPVFSD